MPKTIANFTLCINEDFSCEESSCYKCHVICILQVSSITIHGNYRGSPHYYPGKPFEDGIDGLTLDDEEKARLRHQVDRIKLGIEQKLSQTFGSMEMVDCFIDAKHGNIRYLVTCPAGCGYKNRDLARHLQTKMYGYDKVNI